MATPTFVKFSRIRGAIPDVLNRLRQSVFAPWNVALTEVALLRPSGQVADGGLELAGDMVPVESEEEALSVVQKNAPFALVYLFRRVPGTIALYCFDVSPADFSVTFSFEPNLLSYESDDFEEGQLFKGFLISLVAGLQAEVCGYGRDNAYRVFHESLDTAKVLMRLRSGELLEVPNPAFHAFALTLVGIDEIPALVQARPVDRFLKYNIALGYHVLSNLP